MAEIQDQIDDIEERAKRVSVALDEAEEARKRAKQEVDSLPHDLAQLREQLRKIAATVPIAESLERPR